MVTAATRETHAWTLDLTPEVNPLDPTLRAALARHWLDDALAEHASVAAFTRVATQLLAVGAPPALVDGALAAARDEVRHARQCFTLASMYGAAWKGPGALPVAAVREARCDAASIAREALVEGCLGEGTAAALLARAAKAADDPEVRGVLEATAADEARHADLAWEILRWCLEQPEGAVADAVADALRALPAVAPVFELPPGVTADAWSRAGRATPELGAAAHAEVVARVTERAWRHPKLAGRIQAVSPRRGQPRSRR